MEILTRIAAARVAVREARVERAARRRLSDELAAFVTPAERAELDLLLGRHTLEETREVRAILNRQDEARRYRPSALAGYRGR